MRQGVQFGTAGTDRVHATVVDATGVYVAGEVDGALPNETSAGGIDAFVRKYDTDGNLLWSRQFGTSGDDVAFGIASVPRFTGVAVVGTTDGALAGPNAGGMDAFIRLYDGEGKILWTRQLGTRFDDLGVVIINPPGIDNTVFVGGPTDGVFAGATGHGSTDVFVRRYDLAGNEVWTEQYGTSGVDVVNGISSSPGLTGVVIAGTTDGVFSRETGAGGTDAFLLMFDLDGNVLFNRQVGTDADDTGTGVGVTPEGQAPIGIFVGGETAGTFSDETRAGGTDAWVARFDVDGTLAWLRQFGTIDDELGVILVNSPAVFIAGGTTGAFPGHTNAGGTDIFTRTYDFDGNVITTGQFGTAGDDQPLGAHTSFDFLSLFVVGETDGTFSGETSAGGIDGFLIEVATPTLQLIDLIEAVQALFDAGELGKGEANALIENLESVVKKLAQGKEGPACNKLQAFINKVNELVSGGQLSAADGQALIDPASRIRAQLGC